MNVVLSRWNEADESLALDAMLACCGARRWATDMVRSRPIASITDLSLAADRIWETMTESDWIEAFACHPRIGERTAFAAGPQSLQWSQQEQSSIETARDSTTAALLSGNQRYHRQFGFTFIVCATGKTADEMLSILERRLSNDQTSELREAAEQQRQILQIRLGKWLLG